MLDDKAISDFIRIPVRGGYLTQSEILEEAIDFWEDEFHADDYMAAVEKRHIAFMVDMALKQHLNEQKLWNYETDCDKLDDAFAEMDLNGIVARQNWTCCQTCGHHEIGNEIADAQQYRHVRGYVFFHQQDTEFVTENDTLYLAYGSVDNDSADSVIIGQEIVAILRKHGLAVEWSGMIQKRICIKEIHWQRRRLPESILNIA